MTKSLIALVAIAICAASCSQEVEYSDQRRACIAQRYKSLMQETSASANLAMPAHTVLENCATETQRYKVYLTNNFPGSPFAV
jgi:hypothetical protein